ncbi:NUDIX hydrolase [Chordicoccus furentiruminis]|uniref:NUDIX hydrolase n=1 Tax=Chordicoccus furentiruminis TaxID=2709410 RepID=UPI0023A7E42F|nr:NUDIX hydrolase [Chordicoccus furentiruminis]
MKRESADWRIIAVRTDQELAWEPVSVEHIVRDEWIDFRKVRYRYPDGREFGPFYQYSRKSYSVIVPVLPDGRFLCVRQFRQGIGETTTEFPAGGIEADGSEYGQVTREDALAAAKRELKEETGYESDEWTHLITIPSNATIADNYAHVFLARNCRKVSGLHLDVTEDLEPVIVTKEEIETMISEGRFQQMGHVMAYLLAVRKAGSL